jgi:hypothetical protein
VPNTLSAKFFLEDQRIFVLPDGLMRAGRNTVQIHQTFFMPVKWLGIRQLAFGVRTPRTAQRAAFHKYQSAAARPVVHRKSLDVEYYGT